MPHHSKCSDCVSCRVTGISQARVQQSGTGIPTRSLEGCLQARECSALAAAFSEMAILSQKRYLSFSQYPKLREAAGKPVKSDPALSLGSSAGVQVNVGTIFLMGGCQRYLILPCLALTLVFRIPLLQGWS